MYTLRIIDQSKVGSEERRNVFIGNEYYVLMKTEIQKEGEKQSNNKFNDLLNSSMFIGEDIKYHVVGFVLSNEVTYPIYDWNVVYIVGNEGQTIERVYGIYKKY